MKSYWIWNYGDFEIFHSNLIHSRREELGAEVPAFWKFYDVDRKVGFSANFKTEKDGYVKLFLNGIGCMSVDGVRVPKEKKYSLPKGEHTISISVCNLSGLPAAFLESDVFGTNEIWYTTDLKKNRIPVGCDKLYDSIDKNPENFIFSYERKYPVSVTPYNGGTLYDFGKEIFGFLYVENADSEKTVHVSYGESLDEATDVGYAIVFENLSGATSYKLRQRAFRYIFIPDETDLVVYADFEYLPLEYKGSFHCDNEDVNKIWDMCAYTLHLNMREALLEAIKRDRWLWSGDAYQAFKFNRYIFFDKDTDRRTLIALRGKEPFTQHINNVLEYSFYWVIGLLEYLEYYNDIDFIKFIYPKAKSLMEFSSKRTNTDGFVEIKDSDSIFIDHAEIERRGGTCTVQMLYIAANNAMAKLAVALGEDGTSYKKLADELTEKVTEFFWNDEKGAFINSYEYDKTHITRHPNIFAVLYDIATDDQKEKIIKNVFLNEEITPITTPYFEGYELDAMGKIGNIEYIEKMIKSYWKGMLDLGATTVWESYKPEQTGIEHYKMYGNRYGKSLCHAWGASPIYLLGKYFLGVYPTSFGYETFCVCPQLGGFEFIEGTVPIKGGTVSVYMTKEKVKVTATKSGGTLIYNNKEYQLKSGETLEVFAD